MSRRRLVLIGWLVLSVAILFLPGPEVEVGRTYDPPDSGGVSVLPVTIIIGLASLAIGLIVSIGMAIRKRLSPRW